MVIFEVISGIVETLIAVFNNDFGKIPGILNEKMAAIIAIFDSFNVYFYQQWDALVVFLGGIWDEIYYTIMGQLELIIMDIGVWIMGVQTTIINGWNAIVAGVMYVINNFGDLVIQYFAFLAFNLGRALRLIYDLVVWEFTTIWDAAVWVFKNAIPLISKALSDMGISLGKWLKTTGDDISKGFATGWAKVVKMWANAWPDTVAALSTFTTDFTKWLDTTWGVLKKSFASIWDGKTVGKSVTTGILDGLKANANLIIEWMSNLGKSIIDSFLAGLKVEVKKEEEPKKEEPKTVKATPTTQAANELSKSINATASAAAFGAVRSMVTNIYNNSNATAYNLGVNTTASAGDTMQSFAIMGALAS
jgi:hypothetical protein